MATRPALLLIAMLALAPLRYTMAAEPAITTYGQINAQAPRQLTLFSFIVGKWKGTGKTRLEDGKFAQYELEWIGRYILDGMAIADEFHGNFPDGRPYLGISFRHFDTKRDSWVIEYLNVSSSFIRRQVNPRSGSVKQAADNTIVVISGDGQTTIRENYHVIDKDHFTYGTDLSHDGGRSWGPPLLEMTMARVEPSMDRPEGPR